MCLTDFKDGRYIHSWLVFSTQLVNCCPHGQRNELYLCTVAPLLYLLSDLLPPSPLPNVQYIVYRQCVPVGGGGGGVEIYCGPYSAVVLHSVSDKIQNLPNCFTTPNKMTNEDDIKGLVSLKFLRPCRQPYHPPSHRTCYCSPDQIINLQNYVQRKKILFSL